MQSKLIIVGVVLWVLLLPVVFANDAELSRAVDNWKLLETAEKDAQEAYDSVLAEEKADESWWGDILESIGLKDTPEEAAINVKEAILQEREAMKVAEYELEQNAIANVTGIVGTATVFEQFSVPCVYDADFTKSPVYGKIDTSKEQCYNWKKVEQPVYGIAYQLVITPDTTFKVSSSEYCYYDADRIVCESLFRCDRQHGIESGCEARVLPLDTSAKTDSFVSLKIPSSIMTEDDIVTREVVE